MGHSGKPDEFLEILSNEQWPVVGNDPWTGSREFLLGPPRTQARSHGELGIVFVHFAVAINPGVKLAL